MLALPLCFQPRLKVETIEQKEDSIVPNKDGKGPPNGSRGLRDGRGKGQGRTGGRGVGSKKGGKKGNCK